MMIEKILIKIIILMLIWIVSENNINIINSKETVGMGDNTSKITDVNKSLEMSGMGGKDKNNQYQ